MLVGSESGRLFATARGNQSNNSDPGGNTRTPSKSDPCGDTRTHSKREAGGDTHTHSKENLAATHACLVATHAHPMMTLAATHARLVATHAHPMVTLAATHARLATVTLAVTHTRLAATHARPTMPRGYQLHDHEPTTACHILSNDADGVAYMPMHVHQDATHCNACTSALLVVHHQTKLSLRQQCNGRRTTVVRCATARPSQQH